MSLIRKHVAVLQAWACLALVIKRLQTFLEKISTFLYVFKRFFCNFHLKVCYIYDNNV